MEESDFFDMKDPVQAKALQEHLDRIEAFGGGDIAENALEAIALALQSRWNVHGGRRHRHGIVVVTDAPALPLRDPQRITSPYYPENMPVNFDDLTDWFCRGEQEQAPFFDPRKARLLIVTPDRTAPPWKSMEQMFGVWVVEESFEELLTMGFGTLMCLTSDL